MTITNPASSVLLYATVDTFNLDRGAKPIALDICESIGASLTGFLLSLDANAPRSDAGRSLAEVRRDSELREQRNRTNADELLARAAQRGVSAEALTAIDHSRGIIGCLTDHARLHDLTVIGTDRAGLLSDRLIAENLLFETGRPMFVVPTTQSGPFACRKIAVAWDNSRVSARALGDALALFPGVEEVIFLTIGGEKAIHSSLDGADMTRLLKRRGVDARIEQHDLKGRSIGAAIQDSAVVAGADMLVMGGYGHSRLRDFILGGATLSVLSEPRLPVLLSH